MSIELLRYPTYVWAALLVALIAWLVTMFLLHFFVPKSMIERYFKEPYFSRHEIAVYSAFPFNYFRDIMFMRLAGWPNSGKRRGLTEVYKMAPSWFRIVSRISIVFFVGVFSSFLILGIFLLSSFCFLGHC